MKKDNTENNNQTKHKGNQVKGGQYFTLTPFILWLIFKKVIKILSKCLLILVLIFIVSLFISGPRKTFFNMWGIYNGYNLILEYKFSKARAKVIETKKLRTDIDLQEFNTKQIIRVCVQHPYMLQEWFEEKIGHKVKEFSEISDDYGYVIWFFFSDGSISRARPKLHTFLNNSKRICRDNNFIISLEFDGKDPEHPNFYFIEDN